MNTENLSPLYYARKLCDTMMRHYAVNELPPQQYGRATFNYHQGVFLTGMSRIYELCHEEKYLQYIKDWIESVQDEKGRIREYEGWLTITTLDFRQPGNVLAYMYEKTHDQHLLDLMAYLTESLMDYPKNEYGGFWHFYTTPDQMWLDGLYMVGPLLVKYAKLSGKPEFRELAIRQIFLMYEHMQDPKTGLLRHGWDCGKHAAWADPETGLSPEVWGRACGWFVLAIADMLDYIPQDHPRRAEIIAIQQQLIARIIRFQSDEGRWYEVVDKWQEKGNWPENSCTCLFAYSIAKGVRQGYIDRSACESARRAYRRVVETAQQTADGDFILDNICVGTCIEEGTYEYYIARDRVANDLHGVGAFLLMASEMEKMENALAAQA